MATTKPIWYCEPSELDDLRRAIYVQVDYWSDAFAFAQKHFGGCDRPNVVLAEKSEHPLAPDAMANFELRYVGDDYIHGGGPKGRHLEVRARRGDAWSEWERV